MRLLVMGATGKAGRRVTEQALTRGHSVTAFVRTRSLQPKSGLTIVEGDPRRSVDVAAAVPGHDAIISCLGIPHRRTQAWSRSLLPPFWTP